MDESRLEMLTRIRHQHSLAPRRVVATKELERLSGVDRLGGLDRRGGPQISVRFADSSLAPYDLGLSSALLHTEPGAA